jgi:CRP-like cAMP-binding protein
MGCLRHVRIAVCPSASRHRLLLALAQEKLDRLRPNLELVDLPRGQMLLRSNELIDYVYFPEEGMVSLVLQLEDENVIEVGLVGKEGKVGH